MPKKRVLWMSKKPPKAKRERVGGESTAPSEAEWTTMNQFKSFVVKDDEDVPHKFDLGNYVLLLPDGKSPKDQLEDFEYWVGEIKDIRCRNYDPSQVWARIRWLYSGPDVAAERRTFDRTSCARMERYLSNTDDFIHSSSFQDVVNCIPYDESNIEQTMIFGDDFFYRHSFDINTKRITPTPRGTCLCKKPYNPDTTSLMHFCPRSTCQKAFDSTCLQKANSVERDVSNPECAPRYLQLERSLPHRSVKEMREPVFPAMWVGKGKEEQVEIDSQAEIYVKLPEGLLALARSPMVKGKMLLAGGVVGNIPFVYCARRLVYEALKSGQLPPADWETVLKLGDLSVNDLIAEDIGLICPDCGGAI